MDWHIEGFDPSLENRFGFLKSQSQSQKRDYDSESLEPVSIVKTQSRSSLAGSL